MIKLFPGNGDGEREKDMTGRHVAPVPDRPVIPFILLVGAYIGSIVVFTVVLSFELSIDRDLFAPFIIQFVYWAILILGATVRLKSKGPGPSRFSRPLSRDISKGLLLGIVCIVLHVVVTTTVVGVATGVLGAEKIAEMTAREQGPTLELFRDGGEWWTLAVFSIMVVVIAPIVEEYFFRGYMYPVFKSHAGAGAGWMSAVVFAAAHMYVLNFPSVAVLGWLLARGYEQSGSLVTPIVAHMMVNGFVAFLAFVV